MVCAGGACNSIYISSLTLFFSSIGISLTDWLPYLNGLGFVFIIVALLSLYSAKKSISYPPFYLGCMFSLAIFLDIAKIYHNIVVLVGANVGMVACSCYNLKTNMAPLRLHKRHKHNKHKKYNYYPASVSYDPLRADEGKERQHKRREQAPMFREDEKV